MEVVQLLVAGVLAAPGTQASWQLGQQELSCSRRVWQPILANTLQYSCHENPQATGHMIVKSWTRLKQSCMHRHKTFFACSSSAPVRVEHESGITGGSNCAGTWTFSAAGITVYQSLFSNLLQLAIRRHRWPVFLHSTASSGT